MRLAAQQQGQRQIVGGSGSREYCADSTDRRRVRYRGKLRGNGEFDAHATSVANPRRRIQALSGWWLWAVPYRFLRFFIKKR